MSKLEMSLIACPDCRKEFSESLSACPKCHWPREKKNGRKLASLFPLFLIFIVIVAFAFGCFLYVTYADSFSVLLPEGVDNATKRANWGALGDFFGGLLNPVLTFFSLVILAVTLWFNQIELSMSREELAETRKEVARSSDALSAQSDSLQLQNFESTFFHLLGLYHSSVESLNLFNVEKRKQTFLRLKADVQSEILSSDELKKIHGLTDINKNLLKLDQEVNSLEIKIRKSHRMGGDSQFLKPQEKLKKELEVVMAQEKSQRLSIGGINDRTLLNKLAFQTMSRDATSAPLEHYFSTIESLLKYVHEANIVKKEFYNELIRAQMSFDEIYFLYFALVDNDNLKELCTEASIFRKLTVDDFYYGENHMRHYAKKAFGLDGEWS